MQSPQKKQVPTQTVVSLEHAGAHGEIGRVYHELNAWIRANKIKAAGPGFTVFLDPPNEFDPSSGRFEVCLPVAQAPKADRKVQVKKLPACTVAAVQVKGPYSRIPAHYTEMLAWLSAEGWEIAGPPREVYIKRPDAAGGGDPNEFVTEIQFPIRD